VSALSECFTADAARFHRVFITASRNIWMRCSRVTESAGLRERAYCNVGERSISKGARMIVALEEINSLKSVSGKEMLSSMFWRMKMPSLWRSEGTKARTKQFIEPAKRRRHG